MAADESHDQDRGDLEDLAERSENALGDSLRELRDRANADFEQGKTVTWQDVKNRNGV